MNRCKVVNIALLISLTLSACHDADEQPPTPSPACTLETSAGEDLIAKEGETTVTLAAQALPANAQGLWTIVSGDGGTLTQATNPHANFTGQPGTRYTLEWTVTQGDCQAKDPIQITLQATPPADHPLAEVVSISPDHGPKGTRVSITGINFSTIASDNVVTFNGKPAVVVSATATSLTVTVPAAAGTGAVAVSTYGRQAIVTPVFTFEWSITSLTHDFPRTGTLAVDQHGNVYTADFGNNKILKMAPDGRITTLAGSGARGYKDGEGSQAMFREAIDVAIGPDGNIYVVDRGNNRIRKITPDGMVSTLAGSGGRGAQNGEGTQATFDAPECLVLDSYGTAYIGDWENGKIRTVDPAGFVGTRASDAFRSALDIAVDLQGNVYVTDRVNNAIVKANMLGTVIKCDIDVWDPNNMVIDRKGNMYLTDYRDGGVMRLRKIDANGAVEFISSPGGFQFSGLAVDLAGAIYTTESNTGEVIKID